MPVACPVLTKPVPPESAEGGWIDDVRFDRKGAGSGAKAGRLRALARGGVPVPPTLIVNRSAFTTGPDDRACLHGLAMEVLHRRTRALLAGGPVLVRGSADEPEAVAGAADRRADHRDLVTDVASFEELIQGLGASWRAMGASARSVLIQRQVIPVRSGLLRRTADAAFAIDWCDGAIDAMAAGWIDPEHAVIHASGPGRTELAPVVRQTGRLATLADRLVPGAWIAEWAIDASGAAWVLGIRPSDAPRAPAPGAMASVTRRRPIRVVCRVPVPAWFRRPDRWRRLLVTRPHGSSGFPHDLAPARPVR